MRFFGLRLAVVTLSAGLVMSGCVSEDPNANRVPGAAISTEEAQVLANVLHEDFLAGGAEFSATAPYTPDSVLTMTGTIDFAAHEGTFDALTTFTGEQPDEVRTVYFTADQLVVGNLPGFAEAMSSAGRADALYLRTNLDPSGRLIDNIVGMVQRLAATEPDDPDNLVQGGYTWQGNAPIDGALVSTYVSGNGATTISVGARDQLLHQLVATPAGANFAVTINLTDHGDKVIDLPPEEQIADASAYPDVASQFGF